MKRSAFVIVLTGGIVALAAWQYAADGLHDAPGPRAAAPGNETLPTAPAAAKTTAPVAGAGFVVHLDEDGQIIEEPQGDAENFDAALRQSISTSSQGLVEEATPVGGGVMINLQGRFQSAATATIDANGNVVVPCLTNENDVDAFTSTTAASRPAVKE